MAGKRKGKSSRRASQKQVNEPEEVKRAPHSFVLYRGQVGKHVAELMKDFRKVMEPYTASQLKVLRTNALKDFIAVSGVLNVSHMVMFTKSSIGVYMRIIRLPHGPTLTFRVMSYSSTRDVISALKRPLIYAKQFQHHPLIVLNNFSGEGPQMKLMATTFQNMFPSINVHKVKLNCIRRCVLMNYNSDDSTIDFRHYTIKLAPTGLSKGVKKLIQNKVPNLGNFNEISEFMIDGGNLSESEVELDGPANQVTLPQNVSSRGNMVAEQSAIRLVELGPRIKLCLIKIEDGVLNGEVLYHKHLTKTPEEIAIIRKNILKKRKLKEKRHKQQEENIKLKAQGGKNENKESSYVDNDNDAEWYKKETGVEADKGNMKYLFTKNTKKRQLREEDSGPGGPRKRMKLNERNSGARESPKRMKLNERNSGAGKPRKRMNERNESFDRKDNSKKLVHAKKKKKIV
uniref:Brix domain-containing protein n=1 Tax=Strigamia maritima TaxID=126957 RepID=T1J3I8_STRMM